VVHNTALNSSDNLPCYPPDNHHSSDDVYRRGELSTDIKINIIRREHTQRHVKRRVGPSTWATGRRRGDLFALRGNSREIVRHQPRRRHRSRPSGASVDRLPAGVPPRQGPLPETSSPPG